ncbi:hypothetical protein DFH08DRAFT_819908 [Mycena albidolilacea]|uniref:Uncharacterized protein n=1 Tax=Mycena albidolilacea TaxID=1033008 RepID=A0AAD6ZDG4_9AGAR|nr:hypothetical protein DFH08DRAFT_819908 [Mycena albidolilacea]
MSVTLSRSAVAQRQYESGAAVQRQRSKRCCGSPTLITAPPLKQNDIAISQRDSDFVSGMPTSLTGWFVSRVPETQRTCSNPIPLTNLLEMRYGQLDPDPLFPELWSELKNSFESTATISSSNAPLTTPHTSTPSLAIAAPLPQVLQSPAPLVLTAFVPQAAPDLVPNPEFLNAPVSVFAPSSTALFALDTHDSPQLQEIYPNSDDDENFCDNLDADEEFQAPPVTQRWRQRL